jgi:hypothetical protein
METGKNQGLRTATTDLESPFSALDNYLARYIGFGELGLILVVAGFI